MTNIFDGFSTLFTSFFNFMGLGTDLIIITLIAITILATKIELKDKLLATTILLGGMAVVGFLTTMVSTFIIGTFGILTAIYQIKE